MNDNLVKVINSIAEDILSLAHLVLDENGLRNSALKEDARCTVEASGNPVISILFNDYIDYIDYIESGRKPGG